MLACPRLTPFCGILCAASSALAQCSRGYMRGEPPKTRLTGHLGDWLHLWAPAGSGARAHDRSLSSQKSGLLGWALVVSEDDNRASPQGGAG